MNWLPILATIVTLGSVYAIITLSLNLQLGYTGIINFGIVGYVAVGAYSYAICVIPPPGPGSASKLGFGLPVWLAAVAAMLITGAVAVLTAGLALRFREEYVGLVTFGLAEMIGSFLTNASSITSGTEGFSGLPQPLSGAVPGRNYTWVLAGISVLVVSIVYAIQRRATNSAFGRALVMVRDDELAASLAGKQPTTLRLQAFAIGGVTCGIAGVLYAWYATYIDPTQFDIILTITIFAALAVGGIGSNSGAVVGAVVLIAFQQITQAVGNAYLSNAVSSRIGTAQIAVEGLAFIVLLRLRPNASPRRPAMPGRPEARTPARAGASTVASGRSVGSKEGVAG